VARTACNRGHKEGDIADVMTALERVMLRIQRKLCKLPLNPLNISNTQGKFLEYFKGFDKVEAVRGIFGEKTFDVLSNLKVEFTWIKGYMYVDGSDGHLVISKAYLQNGDKTDIYLNVINLTKRANCF